MAKDGECGMPLGFAVDHVGRSLVARGGGTVTADHLVRLADDVLNQGLLAYGKLIDFAPSAARFTAADLTSFVLALHLIEADSPSGEVAVVIDRAWPDYAALHASLKAGNWPFLLTDTIDHARRWLGERSRLAGCKPPPRLH